MAVRFAISSSDWSSGSTWNGFYELGFPTADDDVYSNSYTVNIDQNITVRSLNNSTTPLIVDNIATPAMTSNATPSGFVYASTQTAGAEGWRAFSQDAGVSRWLSTTNNAANLTYEFPTPRNIKRYALRASSTAARTPGRWTLEGSDDNISFTVLHTVTASLAVNTIYTSPILANTSSFTFYRLNITAVTTLNNLVELAELGLTESTGSGAGNLSGGGFNFNTPDVSASVAAGLTAGATNLIQVTATTGTVNISAPFANVTGTGAAGSIAHSGACDFIITGSSFIGGGGNQICINKSSAGLMTVIGTINANGSGINNGAHTISCTLGDVLIIGNLLGSAQAQIGGSIFCVSQTSGNLTIRGNIMGGLSTTGNATVVSFSGTSLTITGSVTGGGSTSPGINTGAPIVNISGSITGGTGNVAITSATALTMTVTGSVTGGAAAGISLTGAATVNIQGPITGGSGAVGISSTSTSATNRLTGPFITGPTGIQPFYGPKLTIVTGSATFWTFTAPNLTTNKTLYSTDLVSGVPSPSDVRQGITYASGALTGTMIVPATSSVAFGVPVDTFTGSAIIVGSNYNISNEVWNTPVASLTGSATIGERLKNNATVASTGAQIAALAGGN